MKTYFDKNCTFAQPRGQFMTYLWMNLKRGIRLGLEIINPRMSFYDVRGQALMMDKVYLDSFWTLLDT